MPQGPDPSGRQNAQGGASLQHLLPVESMNTGGQALADPKDVTARCKCIRMALQPSPQSLSAVAAVACVCPLEQRCQRRVQALSADVIVRLQ